MNNDRDMYYNTYGYSSVFPNPMMNSQNMPMAYMNQNNELENRLSRMERQIKRLDQRLSRLENPTNYNQYTEPDTSMYMM
jgi:predicted RNase H-like nuclease (RuvC/YqgF family)